MIIRDGYSLMEAVEHSGQTVWLQYRPMLRHERQELAEYLQQIPEKLRSGIVREALLARVQHCDAELARIEQESPDLWDVLCRKLLGVETAEQEPEDEYNLRLGAALASLHPYVATRSCEHCQVWWYDHYAGEVLLDERGEPMPRPQLPDYVPMCRTHQGCAKGTPERSRALSPKNRTCWEYHTSRAGSLLPDDPIVRWHAGVLREVAQKCQKPGVAHAG